MKFLLEFIKHPIQTGSVIPSSKYLARKYIELSKLKTRKTIVELGAGNGCISKHIQKEKDKKSKYFAIEINSKLSKIIRENHPNITLYEDNMLYLRKYLKKHNSKNCDCIISGIPWTNFHKQKQIELINAIYENLEIKGVFLTIAYIYSPYLWTGKNLKQLLDEKFETVETSKIVWRNFPPAIIYVCTK